MLVLCASDQQHNDGNILATIEDRLTDDEAMSELANTESSIFDDGNVCQCDDTATSRNQGMLTPDDNRSGGVAPASDNVLSFDDGSSGFSNVCVLPAGLSYTTQSDIVESRVEETFSNDAADDRRHLTDCAVDACSNDSVSAVDYVVGSASYSECDTSALADDASKTACSVTEHDNRHVESVSDTRSPDGERLEMADVSCDEVTSSASVIDTYAVVDSSNVISDVDNTLIVGVPDTESAGNVTSCCADSVLADDTQQNGALSDEAVRLELAEAISIEAKKKGFRVRFHEGHVTGYHDPPTPWREGWYHSLFGCTAAR